MKTSGIVSAVALVVVVVSVGLGAQAPAAKPAAAKPAAAGPRAADPAAAARAAIEATNAKMSAALVKGDSASAAALYASDAVDMLPGAPMMVGSAAIQAGFAAFVKDVNVKVFAPKTLGVFMAGDYAVEHGTFDMTLQPKAGGAAVTDKGKYLTVWKKQADGGWKVVRDINNSDK